MTRSPILRAIALVCFCGLVASATASDFNVLPRQPVPFSGTLSLTEEDSTATYPSPVMAPEAAPNILLVMTDDVGFGAVSTFGGPVPAPNLDRLAAEGVRFNR